MKNLSHLFDRPRSARYFIFFPKVRHEILRTGPNPRPQPGSWNPGQSLIASAPRSPPTTCQRECAPCRRHQSDHWPYSSWAERSSCLQRQPLKLRVTPTPFAGVEAGAPRSLLLPCSLLCRHFWLGQRWIVSSESVQHHQSWKLWRWPSNAVATAFLAPQTSPQPQPLAALPQVSHLWSLALSASCWHWRGGLVHRYPWALNQEKNMRMILMALHLPLIAVLA